MLELTTARFERRLGEEIGGLRVEMAREFASIRVEFIKWSFLFWIGQIAAVGGLMAILLKTVR